MSENVVYSRVATPLVVQSLRVARSARDILVGIDLEVGRGEVCMLMGASGSGKTTITAHHRRASVVRWRINPGE